MQKPIAHRVCTHKNSVHQTGALSTSITTGQCQIPFYWHGSHKLISNVQENTKINASHSAYLTYFFGCKISLRWGHHGSFNEPLSL